MKDLDFICTQCVYKQGKVMHISVQYDNPNHIPWKCPACGFQSVWRLNPDDSESSMFSRLVQKIIKWFKDKA